MFVHIKIAMPLLALHRASVPPYICCCRCLGMNLVMTEVKLLLAVLLRGGLSWSFADPRVLSTMEVFPGLRPSPGSDRLLINKQQQPLC
jgi:hypothetical protein